MINDILKNLDKIYNFDLKWTTLITNKPALFEDYDYLKISKFIDNEINQTEIDLYKSGKIRNLYANFETLLILNLKRYDRIINYGTMLFYQYVNVNGTNVSKNLENIITEISITPTKLGCIALTSPASTLSELEYGWNVKLMEPPDDVSPLEHNWGKLYKLENFRMFMQYCALRCNTNGFRETWINDITNNKKLSKVCTKFTNKSKAIDVSQLNDVVEYYKRIKYDHQKLINSLRQSMNDMFISHDDDDNQKYGIYVYNKSFYLHTIKFSMRVDNNDGIISKSYIANSHECFIAEKYLISSMMNQIEWTKNDYTENNDYVNSKNILISLLYELLTENYHDVVAIKNMYGNVFSKVTFSGIFSNVYINESLILEGRTIKINRKCLSKLNAATYLIDNGYVIFGYEDDVNEYLYNDDNNTNQYQKLIKLLSKYCKPVMTHMFDVINLYTQNNNNIIDLVVYNKFNPERINNISIQESNIKTDINPLRQFIQNKNKGKGYWKVIG